jgi:hypothetical protein
VKLYRGAFCSGRRSASGSSLQRWSELLFNDLLRAIAFRPSFALSLVLAFLLVELPRKMCESTVSLPESQSFPLKVAVATLHAFNRRFRWPFAAVMLCIKRPLESEPQRPQRGASMCLGVWGGDGAEKSIGALRRQGTHTSPRAVEVRIAA